MRAWPSGWPYRPGGISHPRDCPWHPAARAPMSLARRTVASPLLPTGRAPPGRRCSRRSAPRERRVPAGSGQAFRRCAPGDQPSTPSAPAAPAVQDRSPAAPGRSPSAPADAGAGSLRRTPEGGLPGRCCGTVVGGRGGDHGPVTGACPRGVPSSRSYPGTVSRGGSPSKRGHQAPGGGADGSARWGAPRRRVPYARRGCPPHPAVPCPHRGRWRWLSPP